eukprot:6407208-Amphidinium_carterae.1
MKGESVLCICQSSQVMDHEPAFSSWHWDGQDLQALLHSLTRQCKPARVRPMHSCICSAETVTHEEESDQQHADDV